MDNDFEAVILSACRTPIGSFGGALKDLTAVHLGAIVIREALSRAGLNPDEIGVKLTEGFMMDPEASVSALVFHHPAAKYFKAE